MPVAELNGSMTDADLAALLDEAVRISLESGADPRDAGLIPGEESFRGLFF